jgi:hypothetical protein
MALKRFVFLCPKNLGELWPQMAGFGGRRLGSRPSFSVLTGRCGLEQSWLSLAIAVRPVELC